MYLYNHTSFIEGHIWHEFNQIMGDSSLPYMFEDNSHGGGVCEATLLLIESEVGWMEVDNETRRMSSKLLEDIAVGFDFIIFSS